MKANMEGSSVLRAISKQTGQVSPTHTKERALIEHVSLFLYSSSTTDEANFDGGLLVTIDAPKATSNELDQVLENLSVEQENTSAESDLLELMDSTN